jgi:hypothetical protein
VLGSHVPMNACTMLNPCGPPLGHAALCPCDACVDVRQSWAERQPAAAAAHMPTADVEDAT